jgi:hypothetical protein
MVVAAFALVAVIGNAVFVLIRSIIAALTDVALVRDSIGVGIELAVALVTSVR